MNKKSTASTGIHPQEQQANTSAVIFTRRRTTVKLCIPLVLKHTIKDRQCDKLPTIKLHFLL